MKKIILSFLTATISLVATPKAVIFDWGNVLATPDRSVVVDFMCQTFNFSESEFERVNLEKRKEVKAGKSDVNFWLQFAQKKKIALPSDWSEKYTSTLKASVGADPRMYALVDELKSTQICIGLLSNINDRWIQLIRDFGFYKPFDPCLLSFEIGVEKPDSRAYQILLESLNCLPNELDVF